MSHRSLRSPVVPLTTGLAAAIAVLAVAGTVPAYAVPAYAVAAYAMPVFGIGSAATAAPASTVRAQEWWLAGLNVTQAWQQTRGAGVTVAVLGTGVAAGHPDLAGNVITGPDYSGSGRTPGGPFWGIDGTQVAAIIAGHGDGPGRRSGIIGVAPAAKILSIRVNLEFNDPLNADQAITRRLPGAIADGITYAVNHGARVIDLPLDPGTFGLTGGTDPAAAGGSPAEQAAVSYALHKNVVLVAPAGDDGDGTGMVNHPAAYAGVIAVGAVDRNGHLAPFSNRRSDVALTAPGVNLTAASPPAGYATVSSTSAASGIVAGVAALLLSRFPQLTAAQVTQTLTKSTATTAVTEGAAGPGTGYGTPDAARAVTLAADISTATRPAVSPSPSPSPSPTATATATATPRRAAAIPRRANASALAGSLVRDIVAALGVLIVLVVVLLLIMSSRRRRVLAGRVPPAAGSPGPPGRSRNSRGQHGHRWLNEAPRTDRTSGPDRAPRADRATGPDWAPRADRATGPGQETALGIRPPLAGPAAPAGPAADWPAPGGWQGGGVGEIAHPPAAPGRPALAPAPRTTPAPRNTPAPRGGSGAGTPAGPPWAPAPEPEPERTFRPPPVTSASSFTREPDGSIRVPRDMPPLPTTTAGPWPAAIDPTERPAPASALTSPAPAMPRPSAEPATFEPTVTPDLGPPTVPGLPRLDTGQDPVDPDVTRPVPSAAPPSRTSLGFAAAPVAAVYPAPDLPVDYRVPSDAPAPAGPGGGTDSSFLWDLAATDVFPVASPEPPEAPDDDAPGASGS